MTAATSDKYKILVFPYTHALSHLSRPLSVAKFFQARGADVLFAGGTPKLKFIKEEGFDVLPLKEPDPDLLFNNIRRGKLQFIDTKTIYEMIKNELALINHYRPDLLLSDGRFTAPISAQISRVPHAAIVNVSSTEFRALPYVPFCKKVNFMKSGDFAASILRRINLYFEMIVFDNAMRVFKNISKSEKLPKRVTATNCLTGADLTLLADIPEYFPARNLPDNYFYIGPLTWKSSTALPRPNWWPVDRKDRRLVYITMGTTGEVDFFPIVKKMVLSSRLVAIITTGGQVDGIENVPGRLYVEPYMDGDMVAEACDLVICHGGNGTIYQALSHGKPIIGLPTLPDQSFNMRRVEALGVGKTISFKKFVKAPDLLLKAIEAVFADYSTYQRNAEKLKSIIKQYDGAKLGAEVILNFLNQRR